MYSQEFDLLELEFDIVLVRVLDYVQTAVYTSVKCAHYVQILLPGRKRTSGIPLGTSDFTGVDVLPL